MLDIDSAISKFKTSIQSDRTCCSARKQGKKVGIAYAECGEMLFSVYRAGHKYVVEGLCCYCDCKQALFLSYIVENMIFFLALLKCALKNKQKSK